MKRITTPCSKFALAGMQSRLGFCLAAAAAAALLSGCSELDLRKNIPWGEKDKPEVPGQLVAFWTDAVQNQAGHTGKRGFGGRLYFYGKNPNKPVKVAGSIVIYAFDETDRDPKNVIPDKKFVFSAEQFKSQYEKTELGPSYSIWLPWDDVGGIEKQISLIARFTSEKGEMVTSDQSKMLLPGLPPPKKELPPELAGLPLLQSVKVPSVPPMPLQARPIPQYRNDAVMGARQADYQEPVGAAAGMNLGGVTPASFAAAVAPDDGQNATPVRRMETATFDLPPQSLRQRASAGNASPLPASANPNPNAGPIMQPLLGQPAGVMPATSAMPGMSTAPQANMSTNSFGRQLVGPAQNGASVRPLAPANPAATSPMNATPQQQAAMSAPDQSLARSGFERSRVLGAPLARLDHDHEQWQPFHAESPFSPPSGPQSAPPQ
jgi:hypothetical protein